MKFTINNQSLSKSIIELNEVRWAIYFKKIRLSFLLFGFFAILLLVIGISSQDNYSLINTGEKRIYFDLNIVTSFGIAIVIVLLYMLRNVIRTKMKFLKTAQDLARKFEDIDEIIYEFNEHEIIIDRKLSFEKINWKLFTNKTFHDKFIFLNYSENLLDGVSIDGRFLSESDFNELKLFIDKKIV